MKVKWIPLLIIAAFAGIGGLLAIADARAEVNVEAATDRLRSTLEKVKPSENHHVGDVRTQPQVPELDGVKHRVPDVRQYGNTALADPVEIAKRYRQEPAVNLQMAEQGDLMVFVSFSMPTASLKRIAHETAKVGGVMVIRGFKDGSLRATIKATEEMAALKGKLLIHPELFDHYQIHEVPTTVLARSSDENLNGCSGNSEQGLCTEHLQVKGDVSLHAALEYFTHNTRNKADKTLTEIAEAKLAKLDGKS